MIPILYSSDKTEFTAYGYGALRDTIECLVTEERNGAYELTLKYPVGGFLFNKIATEMIIKAKAKPNGDYQAFRIYRITRPMSGVITVYAQHISYDLANIISPPVYFRGAYLYYCFNYFFNLARPSETMQLFSFENTAPTQEVYLETNVPRNVRSLLIGKEESIVNYMDGDFEFDNYVIRFHKPRGQDNGVTILFGKNLTQIQSNVDITNVYSHLCPYAITKAGGYERLITLTEAVLPAETVLDIQKCLLVDLSDQLNDSYDSFEDAEDALRDAGNAYLREHKIGITGPNITLSFDQLGEANFDKSINLCDTVTVKYKELGISVKTQITKMVYDTLTEKIKTISLGEIKPNLADDVSDINKELKQLKKRVNYLEKNRGD